MGQVQESTRVHLPPEKPLMVYDGDCGFCRRWVARWKRTTAGRVEVEPYQTAQERFPEIPLAQFKRAVQLIDPDGSVSSGAEAVIRSLATVPYRKWMGMW